MDAIEFIRERNRMCKSLSSCKSCPIHIENGCPKWTEEQVPIVEKWSSDHPRKTRQSVFIQQYPEVTFDYGIINIKPCQMVQNYTYGNCNTTDCPQCRKEYWMQEVD